jgi:hypothetical protein
MVIAGTGEDSSNAYWLNLQTGQRETIDAKIREFFPQGEIAWFRRYLSP